MTTIIIDDARRANKTSDVVRAGQWVVLDAGGLVLRVCETEAEALVAAEEIEEEFDRDTSVQKVVESDA